MMQSVFGNAPTKPQKRNYLLAFISFLLPMLLLFLPELFEPLKVIKNYLFGQTPPDTEYYTLDDIALFSYFGLGCLLGIAGISLPNKKILTIIMATLGILLNVFLLAGTAFDIKTRGLIQ